MKLRALCSLWPALAFLCGLSAAGMVSAHEIRPALLEITERKPGRFDVTWKVPTR